MSEQEKLLMLTSKVNSKTFAEIRANPNYRPKTQNYHDFREMLIEKVQEDWVDKKMGFSLFSKNFAMQDQQSTIDSSSSSTQKPQVKHSGKGKGKGKGLSYGKGFVNRGKGYSSNRWPLPKDTQRSYSRERQPDEIFCDSYLSLLWQERSL